MLNIFKRLLPDRAIPALQEPPAVHREIVEKPQVKSTIRYFLDYFGEQTDNERVGGCIFILALMRYRAITGHGVSDGPALTRKDAETDLWKRVVDSCVADAIARLKIKSRMRGGRAAKNKIKSPVSYPFVAVRDKCNAC